MHIVFYINTGGGPESLVKNISSYFYSNGFKLSVILPNNLSSFESLFPSSINLFFLDKGNNVLYYLYSFFKGYKILLPLFAYLFRRLNEERLLQILKKIDKENKIDVVELIEGQFIERIRKKWKVVTRAHGSDWSFRYFCKDQDNSLDEWLIRWQKRQHILSDLNYSISQHTKNHLLDIFCFPDHMIEFIPYPIPFEKFDKAKPVTISGLTEDTPLLLSIGRLETRKGMDVLVKSLPEIWKKFPNTHLLILGKENQFRISELKKFVPEEKRGQILFPGFLQYDQIPGYYKLATIYISASQYETFGYTLLEAMACAKPVICTDRGAMPELVRHNENGFVVPYGDSIAIANAVINLLNDKELLIEFGNKGREIACNYDIDIIGKKMVDAYKQLLK